MTLKNAKSTAVAKYGFDGSELFILMAGVLYAYSGEGIAELYNGLDAADSKGKFFIANIRHNKAINCRKVEA